MRDLAYTKVRLGLKSEALTKSDLSSTKNPALTEAAIEGKTSRSANKAVTARRQRMENRFGAQI